VCRHCYNENPGELANEAAQKVAALRGVCVWDRVPVDTRDHVLRRLPVIEVWGIGPA